MPRYVPLWLYECIVAQCTIDFIELGYGLDIVSKKFSNGLKNIYIDISKTEIERDSRHFIDLLRECNISSDSVDLLNNFIYFRFNFRNRFVKRKLEGTFFNPFNSLRKRKLVKDSITYYLFKYISDWELGTNIRIKKNDDWSLENQNKFEELSLIVKQPLPMHDQKKLILQLRKNQAQQMWIKNEKNK